MALHTGTSTSYQYWCGWEEEGCGEDWGHLLGQTLWDSLCGSTGKAWEEKGKVTQKRTTLRIFLAASKMMY